MRQSQKLFLTWLIEDERILPSEDYIGPDDFTEDIFREVAELVYEQHAQEK